MNKFSLVAVTFGLVSGGFFSTAHAAVGIKLKPGIYRTSKLLGEKKHPDRVLPPQQVQLVEGDTSDGRVTIKMLWSAYPDDNEPGDEDPIAYYICKDHSCEYRDPLDLSDGKFANTIEVLSPTSYRWNNGLKGAGLEVDALFNLSTQEDGI